MGEEVFTSSDILSALEASLWTEYTDLTLGIGLKPIHYAIFGIVFVIIGSAIFIARRERVTVTEEATVMLECPYCKHQWRESMSKTHLKSMGYPRVRTLSRRKCPKCAKFIRPKIAATNV
ncbi:MAG: zinc-ribbon domain-containing protein [Candidatus Bathyarchaeota archaeon]|nr:zinc-ribbon domain-containing protein [Candidatus Bathyarchaeota archaeon]